MFKLAYCSANGTELAILGRAVKSVSEIAEIKVFAQQNQNFKETETLKRFIDYAKDADILIISLHGGKDRSIGFQEILKVMPSSVKIYIHPVIPSDIMDAINFSTVEEDTFKKIKQYLSYGGCSNYRNCLYYLLEQESEFKGNYELPLPLPWEGIYHPDFDGFVDFKQYLEQKFHPGRLTVGIWFHREHWSNGDTQYIDAFIREFESRQINVIPVFRKTRKDESLGNEGLEEVIDHFFKMNDQPLVDIVLNLMSFSGSKPASNELSKDRPLDEVLEELGVPFINGIVAFSTRENWNESDQGLTPIDVIANAALPEMDGNIMSLAGAFTDSSQRDPFTGANLVVHKPEKNEIEAIADRVVNWARLKKKKNADKKVAIIFHNYPPRNDTIGSAFGLDSKDSVLNLLKLLKENGYFISDMPSDGDDLINELLAKTTNELRWLSEEEINHRASDVISESTYQMWFEKLSPKVQVEMCQYWEHPPGEFFTYEGQMAVPGMIKGNIFLGIQPPRGNTLNPESVYHSPELPMPHCYYSYYEWIRNTFKADAVIHVGMHGTLEWLPGKALGLSEDCYPRIAISDLPNLYIYIINNPGEGTQAKRRSNCCIVDHLIPVMTRADLYEETAELETQLQEYYKYKAMNPEKLLHLQKIIWEKVIAAGLNKDLNMGEIQPENFDGVLEDIHDYLGELKETQIKTGLHTLGESPEKEQLVELLVSITLIANGEVPSLRRTIAELNGNNLDDLLENRGKTGKSGRVNVDILDDIYTKSFEFIKNLQEKDFKQNQVEEIVLKVFGKRNCELEKIASYVCSDLVPRIKACKNELTALKDGLDAKYIKPGPTGSITRGMAHILPTGRNFYSIDPQTIPSPTAWEAGKRLAEDMIDKYRSSNNVYPENLGIVVFGTSSMRTGGEDEAEIFALLGVRPVWQKENAYVRDLEIIPLEELGRPRIDVTMRISGLYRDTFPNMIDLVDRAVIEITQLDEPDDMNFLAKHFKEQIAELLEKGMSLDQAKEESSYRIFGCKPGTYGAGVCNIIETKQWETNKDLADIYLNWGGYAYSKRSYGKKAPELFKKRLSNMDAAIMNLDSREFEILDSDDFYSFHGGMIASVREFSGKEPMGLVGDSTNPENVKTRTVGEETRFELRSRIFNPKWIDSMKQHGYKGAGDISQIVDHIFGWDATADVMDDKLYEELAQKFVLDSAFSEWIKEVNPWALQNISERLLEAVQRDFWRADQEMLDALKKTYLEMEGAVEEC